MWEAIRSNQRRSWVLISLMGVVLIGLGFAIGATINFEIGGPIGILVAFAIWLILWITATVGGDRILLGSVNAVEVKDKQQYPRLWNVVEEMTIAAGLPRMPRVFVIEDSSPNAFAVGRKQETAAVAVTTGMLERLSRDELQGVVAHELAHIRNLDVRFMTLAAVMMGSIVMISDLYVRSVFYGAVGRRRTSSRSSGGGQAAIVMFVVALVLAILAPILARLLYFACSRKREYLADASAARFTRYPPCLAMSLEKISGGAKPLQRMNRAVVPLFIINPIKSRAFISAFSTHPPTEKRIAILRGMAGGAGFGDYESAYEQVQGKGKQCIGSRTLAAEDAGRLDARKPTTEANPKKEAIARARGVVEFLDRIGNFVVLSCACGVNIKIPPNFKRHEVPCPRCGRKHEVPRAAETTADRAEGSTEAAAKFTSKGSGWESFRCACDRTIQLSPRFKAPRMKCPECGRTIEIEGRA